MIKTKFQEIYKTKYPIIQAGMGPYSTEKLAIAVAKAGGLGLISTVGMGSFELPGLGEYKYSAIFGDGKPADLLNESIDRVSEALKEYPNARFGINIPVSEEFIPTAAELIRTTIKRINDSDELKKKLVAIFTSAGDPLPWAVDTMGKGHELSVSIKKEAPSLVWTHVVPSVRAAKRCVKADVDVIVASGREGGAHCSWRDTSTMILIPEVVKNIDKPIVAAGGFADGRSLVSALALGAIGIQMGTRFIATEESEFEQGWKELLVKATEEDTIVARGFFGPMRFLRNTGGMELVDATLNGASDLYRGVPCGSTNDIINLEVSGLDKLFAGDMDKAPILGGTACGRIHSIPKAKDLIEEIMKEAEETLKSLQNLI